MITKSSFNELSDFHAAADTQKYHFMAFYIFMFSMHMPRGRMTYHAVLRKMNTYAEEIFDFSTAPTAKPAKSYSPGGYMPGISAVSPPPTT